MSILRRRLILLLRKSFIIKESTSKKLIVNYFHNNQVLYNKQKIENELIPSHFNVHTKEKKTFLEIIRKYEKEDTSRKDQLVFIMVALKYMDEFGVNRDIEVYKALFNIFPKGKYIPVNTIQAAFYHFPKHQDTALAIFEKMEDNFVIPDYELYNIVLNTFGFNSYVTERMLGILYWLPKFSNLNPWPVPQPVPTDTKAIACIALKKISYLDFQADITMFKTKDIPDAIDDTWIASTMSQSQQELLAVQPTNKALYVEGPFSIWVDKYHINYFVLKGDRIERETIYTYYDDVSDLKVPFWEKHNFKIPVSIHEQDDGVYYAICATGTSTKDSLLSWIRFLQKTNPNLKDIPIIFKLKSVRDRTYIDTGKKVSDTKKVT